ncbi:MAG: hypothetical protein ACPF9E_08720, partial [Alteromonas oceani]
MFVEVLSTGAIGFVSVFSGADVGREGTTDASSVDDSLTGKDAVGADALPTKKPATAAKTIRLIHKTFIVPPVQNMTLI